MNFTVYKHTSPSGKSYIGITSASMETRLKQHVREARNKNIYKFHKAINKYGIDNFSSEVLESDIVSDLAVEREKYWIKKFDSFKNGYNMTDGGQGHMFGFKHSDESKQKMSMAHTGKKLSEEHKLNISKNCIRLSGSEHPNFGKRGELSRNFGKTLSDDTKQKISETLKTKMSGEGNGMFGKKHKRITCQYCGKDVSAPMFKRWHGDNCKEFSNEL